MKRRRKIRIEEEEEEVRLVVILMKRRRKIRIEEEEEEVRLVVILMKRRRKIRIVEEEEEVMMGEGKGREREGSHAFNSLYNKTFLCANDGYTLSGQGVEHKLYFTEHRRTKGSIVCGM